MAAALAAGALGCAFVTPAARATGPLPAEAAPGLPSVTLAVLPSTDEMSELASVRGLALGQLSAGLGTRSPEQLALDISQGDRVDEVLYDQGLPPLAPFTTQVPDWAAISERADQAPADLVPGLLASTLRAAGVPVQADPHQGAWALIAADRTGAVRRAVRPGCSYRRRCPGLTVMSANLHKFKGLALAEGTDGVEGLQGNDLVIGTTLPDSRGRSSIGIAAPGYYHDLRADWTRYLVSDSTRSDGFVLSTDIAPTILERFSVPVPSEMDGEPIRPGAETTRPALVNLAERTAAIPDRREPVVILCLLGWIAVALAVCFRRPGLRREALAWLALAFAYMPALLLAGAALEPNGFAEGMLIGFGAGALAAVTIRLAPGWRGLAIACAITLLAYAIDVVAGSGLTRLSLLGPNALFGARFYGIGNELEALFAVMVPVGIGAALTARSRSGAPVTDGQATAVFLGAAVLGAVVFGAGRFGADVGAAIVLPVGGAVAAALLPRAEITERSAAPWRRVVVIVVAVPIAALAVLALIDLVSGGNAHLTRSIFDAGGATNLADVAERRLRLSAHDFGQAARNPLFWIVAVGIGLAVSQWRRIDACLQPAPIARAGVIGACAAVAVGVLVNDSGASFLVLGAIALGASVAFAWSQAATFSSSPRNAEAGHG
jgi:hypothetical protein